MGKVVRVGGRGTSRRVTEKAEDNWTGDAYKDVQSKRKAAAGGIHSRDRGGRHGARTRGVCGSWGGCDTEFGRAWYLVGFLVQS